MYIHSYTPFRVRIQIQIHNKKLTQFLCSIQESDSYSDSYLEFETYTVYYILFYIECRCNGRLQTKRFTRLAHTGSVVETKTMLI